MTRIGGKTLLVAVFAALLLESSVAGAQETSPPPSRVRRAVNPAEQAANAQAVLQHANVLAQRISQMLEEARRESDIIRVTCLNDKLTQVNANTRIVQTRLAAFNNATTPEQRNHEATVISVLGQKLQTLDGEANRCVGQDVYETGSTKVETSIDTSLLPFEDDAARPIVPPPTIVVPDMPVFASGTM